MKGTHWGWCLQIPAMHFKTTTFISTQIPMHSVCLDQDLILKFHLNGVTWHLAAFLFLLKMFFKIFPC